MNHTNKHHAVEWRDGQPYSTRFEDVYFSRESGLDETRHVFLRHNQLQQRWASLSHHRFTIAETGFGTGLNFLCAWQLWRKTAPRDARLHFISVERYPLTHGEMEQALALWPELTGEVHELLAQYRMLSPGWHRLWFDEGKVCLTLIIGDALECLPLVHAQVDAWFLDGFAPARNPEMWQPALFDQMARLSSRDATFATFTSAGAVKRGLQQAGFEVQKVAGYGRKREMLCGEYRPTNNDRHQEVAFVGAKASHAAVKTVKVMPDIMDAEAPHAVVIGAGIAGTSSAYALASRGWQVTLIDRHGAIAREASGNPLGVIYPRLAGQDIVLGRLALHGYLNTLRLLQRLAMDKEQHSACGLLQTAFDARELARCQAIAQRGLPADIVRYVDAHEASAIAGMPVHHPALYFPDAGWVDPVSLCRTLASHPGISLTHADIARLVRNDDQWEIWASDGRIATAPIVIVAGANQAASFDQTRHLPLEPVRGQITFVDATAGSERLMTVLCSDGYVSPSHQGRHFIGATFAANDTTLDLRNDDHQSNLAMLRRLCPALHESIDATQPAGRAALRCATPDYLPMTGPVLDAAALRAKPPRHTADPATLPWLEGLYINTGHGSKGLINAPLCAEMLASAICGEPAPVDTKLLAALDPNRFLLRKMGLKRLVVGLAGQP